MRAGSGEAVQGEREIRPLVIPVAVFFLKAPRTPLNAAAGTDIKAAVEIPCRVSNIRGGKGGGTTRPALKVDPRDRAIVVAGQAGPPTLGADVPSPRRPYWPPLRVRLTTTERHG